MNSEGWAAAPNGRKVWGRNGAAGLFLVAERPAGGVPEVLLQHRSMWTSGGGTWALPGGAIGRRESPVTAALRESAEEASLDKAGVEVLGSSVTAGPFPGDPLRPGLAAGWTYTTVIARTVDGRRMEARGNYESVELRWVPVSRILGFHLLPAFRASLPGVWGKFKELK